MLRPSLRQDSAATQLPGVRLSVDFGSELLLDLVRQNQHCGFYCRMLPLILRTYVGLVLPFSVRFGACQTKELDFPLTEIMFPSGPNVTFGDASEAGLFGFESSLKLPDAALIGLICSDRGLVS